MEDYEVLDTTNDAEKVDTRNYRRNRGGENEPIC